MKQVQAKEPPTTLVAMDNTRCYVTAGRFEDVAVGDRVWCTWQRTGIAAVGPGR